MSTRLTQPLMQIHDALLTRYGPQHWWPADSPVEVIIGAILTQNTNWRNVERAIQALRHAGALDLAVLHELETSDLEKLIQPSGTFRVKAKRLRTLVHYLVEHHDGRLENLADISTELLRAELLSLSGIGPETADAILLYALQRPTFVVDAYTRRLLLRHGLIDLDADYDTIKSIFEDALPPDVPLFNEFHALIVRAAKDHCRVRARCDDCPLNHLPHDERADRPEFE